MIRNALGPDGIGKHTLDSSRLVPAQGSADGWLIPGFVDVHIHGAFGLDFMHGDDMVKLAEQLATIGYEHFLPTTITASADEVRRATASLPDHPMIPGFHLEGPFISPKHPGAQPPEAILSAERLDDWTEILDHPKLKIITLAPEIAGAHALISRLRQRGVRISFGHSDATYQQAIEAKGDSTTHTFNAMRGFHHREAGLAGYALLEDSCAAELIYDRVHVSQPAASLLIENKPKEMLLAVSDSTLASGLPEGQGATMWGHKVKIAEGSVRLVESGALAGSAITLLDAFRNLHDDFGPETAIRACSLNARAALNLGEPKVWIDMDPQLQIREILQVE